MKDDALDRILRYGTTLGVLAVFLVHVAGYFVEIPYAVYVLLLVGLVPPAWILLTRHRIGSGRPTVPVIFTRLLVWVSLAIYFILTLLWVGFVWTPSTDGIGPHTKHLNPIWPLIEVSVRDYQTLYGQWRSAALLAIYSLLLSWTARVHNTKISAATVSETVRAAKTNSTPPSSGRRRPALLLRKSSLTAMFVPAVVLMFVGNLLLRNSIVDQATTQMVIAMSGLWIILGMLAVGVTLIVTGARER